jgi:cell shape-determining protein MreD
MIYGYHLIVCLFLIVFQSTILAGAGPSYLYDLIAPFVVYLGVHRLTREAIPVLILGGLAMDGISGCVFGVHLSVYLWMFFGVRWAIQFLHVGNVIFLPLLVTAGVLFESLVVAFSAVVLESSPWPVESMFPVVAGQVLWGAVTGPFLMLLFLRGQAAVDRTRKSFAEEKDPLRIP